MDFSGKKHTAALAESSLPAQKKSKQEQQYGSEPATTEDVKNQDNTFLNMDMLSMSMVLDITGLGGTLAVGRLCRRANQQVRAFFRDCGPANVVQKDINFWLKHQSEEKLSDKDIETAIRKDYFLSLKTFLAGSGSIEKKFVKTCFIHACRMDYLKLIKWMLANFEIERESLFLYLERESLFLYRDFSNGLRGACCNNGPNSLAIIDLVCCKFAITKDELLKFGCVSYNMAFPVMKYFFEHFDLTGDDCFKWRVDCLEKCCSRYDLESLKYLVEVAGLTAAEGLFKSSYSSLRRVLSRKELAFVQYFFDAFHVTSHDIKNNRIHFQSLETAKWVIKRFNLEKNDLFNEVNYDYKYENMHEAAGSDGELFKYYIVKFGITEDDLQNPVKYNYEMVIDGALDSLFRGDYSSIEWIRNHWSINIPSDLTEEYVHDSFIVCFQGLLHDTVYLQPYPGKTNSENRKILLYLFEKLNYDIGDWNGCGLCEQNKDYVAALCRTLVRKGWLRFAKCIVGSWVFEEAGPKLTNMVTTAARWGKFAIVKYFVDQGLYQLPSFIHLHHGDVKLKLSRGMCEKLVREADTNVDIDFGLTDSQFEEIQYLYRRDLDRKCYFLMKHYLIDKGLYQPPSFAIHLPRDNDSKLSVPGELCKKFFHDAEVIKNVEFDDSLKDDQIEELRVELNSFLADEADDGFESVYEETLFDHQGDCFRDDFKGYFKDE